MTNLILESLYFILPAYIANMAPVVMMKFRMFDFMALPIDGGVIYKGKRLIGANKSYRGLFGGALFGMGAAMLQKYFLADLGFMTLAPLEEWSYGIVATFGALFGLGALVGDAVESFFKRRVGVECGRPWPPFDQLDFVVGGLIFASPFYLPSWQHILAMILITPLLHLAVNVLAYFLGLKKVWW